MLATARRRPAERNPSAKASANINITPLVDVVLVLLIIFMVVTPLLQGTIALPMVDSPLPWDSTGREIRLTLNAEGELTLNGNPASPSDLAFRLKHELAVDRAQVVLLEADRSLPFGRVRPLLEALRDAGAADVGLAASPLALTTTGPEGEL